MPKSCRQQARGCPRGANLGNGDEGRFPKGASLQQARETRVTGTSWTERAENAADI